MYSNKNLQLNNLSILKFSGLSFYIQEWLKSFLIILLIGVFCSCKKTNQPNTLPLETHNGSNTMGAFINGAAWVVQPCFCLGPPSLSTYYKNGYFTIFGRYQNTDVETDVSINLDRISGTGSYNLTYENISGPIEYSSGEILFFNPNNHTTYITDQNHQGNVNITYFDTIKRIISGTFNMKAVIDSNTSGKTVDLEEGRFDVTYIPPD